MDRKDHSSHQTRQHTVPYSGLSYLPDGWEFAIVTVKPPKSYKDRKTNDETKCLQATVGGCVSLGTAKSCSLAHFPLT